MFENKTTAIFPQYPLLLSPTLASAADTALANMVITFSPIPSLDLRKQTRVIVKIPLDGLAHLDPAVDLCTEKRHHLSRKTGPVARVIAEKLSLALFGSTESRSEPFIHWLLGGIAIGLWILLYFH